MTDRAGALLYLALGGAGEIGMNCYLYGRHDGPVRRWIMVDLGIGFGDMETAPGVELVLPDLSFLDDEHEALDAIFVTHAHEDHLGAIPHLWSDLRVPVYARSFAAEVLRRKFDEHGLDSGVIHEVRLEERLSAGPFEVEFMAITHSVPEASSLVLRTDAGTVLHTGDFKLDPAPQLGPAADLEPFERLGSEGVLALVCDSTNVFLPGSSGSEAEIVGPLETLIAGASGAVAATTFASNVARLRTLALAADRVGRSVVIAGRAMRRMIDVAVDTGHLTDFPRIVREEDAGDLPRENLFYLVTGSQGEARAAVARIAGGTHPSVKLGEGDLMLFSSKTIPGNETSVIRSYNRLSELGVRVVDGDQQRIHVSGHARRDDLFRLYKAVRPAIAVPMHGEHRHLAEHARMAQAWGAGQGVLAPNGTVVDLAEGGAVADHVETGRVYLDGTVKVGALDGVIRDRLKMARQGVVIASVVLDDDGELLADSEVRCLGAPKDSVSGHADLETAIAEAVDDAIDGAPKRTLATDSGAEEIVAKAVRQVCNRYWGKRPVVSVIVSRLAEV